MSRIRYRTATRNISTESDRKLREGIIGAYEQGWSDGYDTLENELADILNVNDGEDVTPIVDHVKRLLRELESYESQESTRTTSFKNYSHSRRARKARK